MSLINLLPNISIPLAILTAVLSFITYIIYKFYLRPYFLLLFYKRQGAVTLFHPNLLGAITNRANAEQKGDYFIAYKEILKNKPDTKVIVENFGPNTLVIPIDTELVKEFLKRYDIYQKDKVLHSLLIEVASGTVVFADDAAWKKKRRMVSGAFNFEFLKHIVPMIVETTQEKFKEWTNSGDLNNVNIVEKLGEITGELTGKFFFGKKFSKQTLKGLPFTTGMQQLLVEMLQELFSISTIVFGTKLIKANILPRHRAMNMTIKEGKDKCRQMIKETENSGKHENNLLNLLLSQRNNGREEDQLTDEEIVGEFIGLFVAGTDTTSHLLGSAIYFLHKYPRVLQKVKEEVDREFADLSKVDIDTINRMEYTSAFIKETLRLGGPVGVLFTRVATQDDDLCGFKIKKGTWMNIFHDMYHTSEKYYSNPMEVIPERWLGDPVYAHDRHKTDPYAFIPFSAGPRNCVGQHLAMIEARILLALFIKTFDFTFPENYKFSLVPTFTYAPIEPLLPTLEVKGK